jgi:hypothetical protein
MAIPAASLPQVNLRLAEWIRIAVVGVFFVLSAARVAPDVGRIFYPLSEFGYVTDADGVVVHTRDEAAGSTHPRDAQRIDVGDLIRMDRIKAVDRKLGFVGLGYTYDNPLRTLPIERQGHSMLLHLKAIRESTTSRVLNVVRVAIFFAIVVLGAILFLVQPSIATAAILAYCLASEGPSTFLSLQIPNPARQFYDWYETTSVGTGRPALLLFAICLIDARPRVRRAAAWVAGVIGLALGTLAAYGQWLATYAARPAMPFARAYADASDVVTWITIGAFFIAFVRTRGDERRRIGWIVASFALASVARLASDAFYPTRIAPWENGLLLTATVLPILVVWVAVVRDRFFNVDFVVSRAVVYVALSFTVIGVLYTIEEVGTYVFIQNTDLAYAVIIAITVIIGSTMGKLRELIESIVDRFIFRDRLARRRALELIAGYILDAETVEDVERALLEDASHALHLSFGGILVRGGDGAYRLRARYNWPEDCIVQLEDGSPLLAAIKRTRGTMRFSGKDTRLIKETFEREQLTFAAPLFFDRSINAIVVYGSSRIGLHLDPEEREGLIEVVAHAAIALHAIELEKYRALAATARATVSREDAST